MNDWETWRPVLGYEELYEVSDLDRSVPVRCSREHDLTDSYSRKGVYGDRPVCKVCARERMARYQKRKASK